MRAVVMELFGSKWSFQADDNTADRLIVAMKAHDQLLRDVRAALRILLEAGGSADVLVPETDRVMQNKVGFMSVEYRKVDGLDQRVLVA